MDFSITVFKQFNMLIGLYFNISIISHALYKLSTRAMFNVLGYIPLKIIEFKMSLMEQNKISFEIFNVLLSNSFKQFL